MGYEGFDCIYLSSRSRRVELGRAYLAQDWRGTRVSLSRAACTVDASYNGSDNPYDLIALSCDPIRSYDTIYVLHPCFGCTRISLIRVAL
jgi:hypothetical protein